MKKDDKPTLEELVENIFKLADELGKFPTRYDINDCPYFQSYNTVLRSGLRLMPLRAIWKDSNKDKNKINCLHCGCEVTGHGKVFCSRSCSAKYYNAFRTKHTNCLHCGEKLKCGKKFCGMQCKHAYDFGVKYEKWINGTIADGEVAERYYKKFVSHRDEYKCSCCGLTEWQGKPITIELEHIDGVSSNNSPENLCLLCPNCHSQTPTYKAKNKGNGRHKRMQRYHEGKSY